MNFTTQRPSGWFVSFPFLFQFLFLLLCFVRFFCTPLSYHFPRLFISFFYKKNFYFFIKNNKRINNPLKNNILNKNLSFFFKQIFVFKFMK